jgi:hypothetical protein
MPMVDPVANSAVVGLRAPDDVMRLACMGANHQNRLSFMRVLLRRLKRENWRFDRPRWDMDRDGFGVAVYAARGPVRTYSLVAFSHDLDPDRRTDRVIATAWDATFALFDGEPDLADIERLMANVPQQEAGRLGPSELAMSRANRSVRLFDHVVESLASGRQPDSARVAEVGYLMRTTAVYGSGKFGAADYEAISDRPEFSAPFQAEMLSVYLTRDFILDLVEHMARSRSPRTAVAIEPTLRRRFGVGNSTGLGLAPYLAHHPVLLHHWTLARETALARVRSLVATQTVENTRFGELVARAQLGVDEWVTEDAAQGQRNRQLAQDLAALASHLQVVGLSESRPWDELYRWADSNLSLDGRELVVSLLLEVNKRIVDPSEATYCIDESPHFRIDGLMSIGSMLAAIERDYAWALAIDFADRDENARFWYVSQEKLEPRLGEREIEPGAELELPIAVGRDIRRLFDALKREDAGNTLASFLLVHPEHRHAVRRAQIAARFAYAEVRDNIISARLYAVDLLRFKLAFFGASRFDPRSDRWLRITMFKDAPFASELASEPADDWFLPPLPQRGPAGSSCRKVSPGD